MKIKFLLFLFYLTSFFSFSQVKITGEWQGIMFENSDSIKNCKSIYFSFYLVNGLLEGKFRQEIYGTDEFSIAQLTGKSSSKNKINFQLKKYSKNSSFQLYNCLLKFNLTYNEKNGYLEGEYECIKNTYIKGKIILFRAQFVFNETSANLVSHNWIDRFIFDIENDISSQEQRIAELKKFKFESIYFESDKYLIMPEFDEYLMSLIKILMSHSDIRIKVIGNTDSDGSDAYNQKLSEKRAQAIMEFLINNGVKKERIEFEFRGEKKPVKSNKTGEGKKKNRRVDFEFI
jgi:outer membrane protein OmpA-like peptidoglycan-associated protein